jgi:GT2 family glycosyltransferase
MHSSWHYLHTPGVTAVDVAGRPGWQTPEGGRIVTDETLMTLWRDAHGRSPADLLAQAAAPDATRAALACLAEGGLLQRHGRPPVTPVRASSRAGGRVSIILVTYRSDEWIAECLASLRRQTHADLELVVVDNGSPDDPAALVMAAHPHARYLRLPPGGSFAGALNAGAAVSTGDYLFFLNPDVALEADAIARLVSAAAANPSWGAVAAKLRFFWATAFLNGLGNRVESVSWGTDNAIGHLDLAQFDRITSVPSACFAAALITRTAWNTVGPVDEGFPMYYEDVEWCYRARRLGFVIGLAPDAIVYHAFGSRLATGDEPGLTPRKLAHVVYGRLRLVLRTFDGPARLRYLAGYVREDFGNYRQLRARGDAASAAAYRRAWRKALLGAWSMWRFGAALTRRSRHPVSAMLEADAGWPPGLVWNGVPDLSWAIVERVYLPLLREGRTTAVPEFSSMPAGS